MPQPSDTEAIAGQPLGVVLAKWLKAIRDSSGQVESDTIPNVNDPIGVTLTKILRVYNRI